MKKKGHSLLVISDGELKVAGNDATLLVVTSSITGEFKNLSCEVFEDGSEVNWSKR